MASKASDLNVHMAESVEALEGDGEMRRCVFYNPGFWWTHER